MKGYYYTVIELLRVYAGINKTHNLDYYNPMLFPSQVYKRLNLKSIIR